MKRTSETSQLVHNDGQQRLGDEGRIGQLLWASFRGRPEEVRRLLELGVSATARLRDGRTALHEAARGGHMGVIEHLLAAGAVADSPDYSGFTPLMRATAAGHRGAVARLLAAGADPERAVAVCGDEEILGLLCAG